MQVLNKIICLWLLFATGISWGQDYFYKVYSSGNFDIGEGICQLPDSSYLITGSSGGFQTTSPQAFVMKVSKNGEQIWTVDKGGEEADIGRRIFYLNDTIYLFGRTNSFGNSYDYYFLKLDSLGQTIHEQTIGTSDFEWLQDVVFLPKDSSFVLYGYWQESNGFTRNRQLLKVNKEGTILWQQEFPMHLEAQLKNAHAITDSTFAITGSEYNEARQKFDGLFYSFDLAGNRIDSLHYYEFAERDYCFNDFALGNDQFFIASGVLKIEDSVTSYMNCPVFGFDPVTSEVKEMTEGVGEEYYLAYEYITQKKNMPNKYFLHERAKKSLFPVFGDGFWDEQIQMFYYSPGGIYWEKTITNISSLGDDITNQVITTLDGGVAAIGYNEYFANQAQNVFMLKIASDDSTVVPYAHPTEESLLQVLTDKEDLKLVIFPNPVENTITVSATQDELEFLITDLNGKYHFSTTDKQIDVSMLQSGIYFLTVKTKLSQQTIKFLKK